VTPNTACEHGNMTLDVRDEWPADVAKGTFDIELGTVEGYPGATAHILFVCPNGQRCAVLLGPQSVPRSAEGRLSIWGWDGNVACPSLTPSINCLAEKDGKPTGGCGWHGFITNGAIA